MTRVPYTRAPDRTGLVRLAAVWSALVAIGLWSEPAAAYVDPTAGGFILQMLSPLLAVIVGGAIMLRDRVLMGLRAIRRLFASSPPAGN
jgi:hypothetical protein